MTVLSSIPVRLISMSEAFEQIVFEKPAKGPTVISFSIRYRLK